MKKIKAGDLVWHVSSSTGSLRPAILVRHAPGRGNKSVINVFENGKNELLYPLTLVRAIAARCLNLL